MGPDFGPGICVVPRSYWIEQMVTDSEWTECNSVVTTSVILHATFQERDALAFADVETTPSGFRYRMARARIYLLNTLTDKELLAGASRVWLEVNGNTIPVGHCP